MALKTFNFSGFTGENARLEPEYLQPNDLSATRNVRINKGVVEASEGLNTDIRYAPPQIYVVSSPSFQLPLFDDAGAGNNYHPAKQDLSANPDFTWMDFDYPGWNPWYLKQFTVPAWGLENGAMISFLLKCHQNGTHSGFNAQFKVGVFADNGSNAPNMSAPLYDSSVSVAANTYETEPNTFKAARCCLTQDIAASTKIWVGFSLPSPGTMTYYLRCQCDLCDAAITEQPAWKDHTGATDIFPIVGGYRRLPIYAIVYSRPATDSIGLQDTQPVQLETSYTRGDYFTGADDWRFLNEAIFTTKLDPVPSPTPGEIVTGGFNVDGIAPVVSYMVSPVELGCRIQGDYMDTTLKMFPHANIGFYSFGNGNQVVVALTAPSCPSAIPITIIYLPSAKARCHVFKDKLVFNDWGDKWVWPKKPTYAEMSNFNYIRSMSAGYAPIYSGIPTNHQYAKFIWTQHGSLYFGGLTWAVSQCNFSEPNQFDTGDAGNIETLFSGEPITAVLSVSDHESFVGSPSKVIRYIGSFGATAKYNFLDSGCPNRNCMTTNVYGEVILTRDGLWLIRQGVPNLLIDKTNQIPDYNNLEDNAYVLFDEVRQDLIYRLGATPVRYNVIENTFTRIDNVSDVYSKQNLMWVGNYKVVFGSNVYNFGSCTYKEVEVTSAFMDITPDQPGQEKLFERIELEFKTGSPTLTQYIITTDGPNGVSTVTSGAVYDSESNGLFSVIIPLNLRGRRIKFYFRVAATTAQTRFVGGKIRYSVGDSKTNR